MSGAGQSSHMGRIRRNRVNYFALQTYYPIEIYIFQFEVWNTQYLKWNITFAVAI